ncbi:helix-turn-helix domain-containing protein [Saccharothrix hoggarensis]|uniref:Helix-turn-helix domain-containing protein n=1 Tax=Saccharothrix hoggarensis TaxID=913853 RepID=A0ABW3QVV9_9PSEU
MPRELDKSIDKAVADLGRDIGEYIREQRNTAKISLRQLAKLAGVSNPYLSQIERGLRKPSAEILQQIAKGLRISAEALYVEAGILEQREGGALADAIVTAPDLTERQKQVLLDVYESFRRENTADGAGTQAVGTRTAGKQTADKQTAGERTAATQTKPEE